MPDARQAKDIRVHGAIQIDNPVHGGIIPPHGGVGRPGTGPIHGSTNLVLTTPGAQVILDSGFDSPGNWAFTGSVSVTGSQGVFTAAAINQFITPNPAIVTKIDQWWRVSYTVVSISGGQLGAQIGGMTLTLRSAPGTYVEDVQVIGAGSPQIRVLGGGPVNAAIDNFQVWQLIS